MTDDLANYHEYLRVMRLRAVMRLDVFPHEHEPVELVLLMLAGTAG